MSAMSFTRATLTTVATMSLAALLSAGCAGSTGQPTSAPTPTSTPSGEGAGVPTESRESELDIRITIGDESFGATLADTPAARDLLAQLPVTLEMTDHGGVEKTGRLPVPLSREGHPEAADPDIGDVGYFAPGNDLVLYYGDQSPFPGILVLGRMDGDAAARIARLGGTVTATVEAR